MMINQERNIYDWITVTKASMPDYEEYCKEIKKFWDSHWLTNMGVEHHMLQYELVKKLECPYVILHTNGHLALENTIAAMGFPRGSEIITTPFTFASTTHAIVRNGLVPVFCDIKRSDCTIDTDQIEALITEKTVAILPVHVYGHVCDVTAIQKIADKYGLKVIYDAAHTFAEKYQGKPVVFYGNASILSFHATKVFNTIEGGAVCTKDENLANKLQDLKNFGIQGLDIVQSAGGNAKMSEFQAAMGICNLKHVETDIQLRKENYEFYMENLFGIKGIHPFELQKDVDANYGYFPVVIDGFKKGRDDVFMQLLEKKILSRKYFYPLTSDYQCYAHESWAQKAVTPVAKYMAEHVLTLPMYAELKKSDIKRICDYIRE